MCAKHTTLHSSTYTQREAEPRGTVVYTHTYIHTQRVIEVQRTRDTER